MSEYHQWQWDASRQNWCYWDPNQYSWVYRNPVELDQSNEKSASTESVGPHYKINHPGQNFYKVGKVFKVLWPEPAGANPVAGATVTGSYGTSFYDRIRWFIVIREGHGSCTCLPIQTYNRQGVAKHGVVRTEHSAVYAGSFPPQIPEWEDPYREMLPAIRIIASDPSETRMDPLSRINYAKVYTVEHNVKTLEFGDVDREWSFQLQQNFLAVLQLRPNPTPGISRRRPASPEKSQPRWYQGSETDRSSTLVSWEAPIPKTKAVLEDVGEVMIYDQAQRQSLRCSSTIAEADEVDTISSEVQQPHILPQSAIPPAAAFRYGIDSQEIQLPNAGQAHSDLGYHSGRGTDTASVCFIKSRGSSVSLPAIFLRDFIEFFGNNLIVMAGVREWMPYAQVAHKTAGIEAHLDRLLKRYARDLEELASETHILNKPVSDKSTLAVFDHNIAKDLIRRYRLKIARYIRQNALSPIDPNALTFSRLKDYGIRLSLDERIILFVRPQAVEGLSQEESLDFEESEDNENFNLDDVKNFLLAQRPFRNLMASMRRNLYCDDQSQMRSIQATITNSFSMAEPENNSCLDCSRSTANSGTTQYTRCKYCLEDRQYRTSYSVAWNPIEFLESQFKDQRILLANVLVLSGSGLYAYATTCAQYVQSTWPNSCNVLLPLLQELLDNPLANLPSKDGGPVSIRFESTWLRKKKQTSVRLEVNGSIPFIIEIVQQTSWLAAALRGGLPGTTVSYSEPSICEVASNEQEVTNFDISVTERLLSAKEESCWLTLFNSAVVTRGFPIPEEKANQG